MQIYIVNTLVQNLFLFINVKIFFSIIKNYLYICVIINNKHHNMSTKKEKVNSGEAPVSEKKVSEKKSPKKKETSDQENNSSSEITPEELLSLVDNPSWLQVGGYKYVLVNDYFFEVDEVLNLAKKVSSEKNEELNDILTKFKENPGDAFYTPSSESLEEKEGASEDSESLENLSYEKAELLMSNGFPVKLPEWEGFWFRHPEKGNILVLTKDGEILDNPNDEFKERNDWMITNPSEEQKELIKNYFAAVIDLENLEKYDSLEAVAFNQGPDTSWRKLEKTINIKSLEAKTHLPAEVSIFSSQFLMDNGQVFNYVGSTLTNNFDLESLKLFK